MTEQRRLWIAKLAQAESRARMNWEYLGRRNAYGRTYEEDEAARVEYALAQAEWSEAVAALRVAIGDPERESAALRGREVHR